MALFSRKKNEGELVAIFDIGSASVGGALVLLSPEDTNDKPQILYSFRRPIKLEAKYYSETLSSRMTEALGEVAQGIMGEGNPMRVFCFLASPWYSGRPRLIKYEKQTPFVFTQEIYNILVQKELAVITKDEPRNKIIESKSVHISLNGYVTNYPLGKEATDLEMSLLVSTSPKEVLQVIQRKLNDFFEGHIEFAPFLSPLFIVTRDVFAAKDNFLLMDVGGEVTDVALIRNGVLTSWLSFPFGKSFFIRRITEQLRHTQEEASSLFSLYLDNRVEDKIYRKIDNVVRQTGEEWLNKLQESLYNLGRDLSLPSTIFLTSDDNVSLFFEGLIREEKLTQYHLTRDKFDVKILSAKILHRFCDFAYMVEDRDPFLILESIYVNRANNK